MQKRAVKRTEMAVPSLEDKKARRILLGIVNMNNLFCISHLTVIVASVLMPSSPPLSSSNNISLPLLIASLFLLTDLGSEEPASSLAPDLRPAFLRDIEVNMKVNVDVIE